GAFDRYAASPRSTKMAPLDSPATLDLDAAFVHLAAADPVLAALLERSRPVPPRREYALFHDLVSAIVSQQLSGKAAETIMRRLHEAVAPGAEITPEAILRTDHETLRAAGLSNAKARYVRGLAEAVAEGTLDLEALPALGDDEVVGQLTRVKGIGRWTAEMILLFSLARPDVLSTGDLGIRTAVMRHYGLPALPAPAELEAIAERWRPHRSAALLVLWHSLDNRPAIDAGDSGS
ncbi:MAG TPA: DNA-3-methyladenine glycosylase, partial [Dehalococcoidia bacterium]|nr:DNA-3-methyladenine glycosylase [Dehalococcoidia bacterium]